MDIDQKVLMELVRKTGIDLHGPESSNAYTGTGWWCILTGNSSEILVYYDDLKVMYVRIDEGDLACSVLRSFLKPRPKQGFYGADVFRGRIADPNTLNGFTDFIHEYVHAA